MTNLRFIERIQVKVFDCRNDDLEELNKFLMDNETRICEIQTQQLLYGVTRYIVIYKESY